MDLTEAIELFVELKRRIDEHGDYLQESEYRTRILLIDPLLRLLGWDVEDFHCVEIEYRTTQSANERADYVLKKGRSKVAVVEAKKLGTVMRAVERRQAKEYADYAGVSQCMLTDGAKWLLYNLNQGRNPDTMQPWLEFDIKNQVPEQLILPSLTLWQQWFTVEAGSSPVGHLLFDSSVDNDRSETNNSIREPQEDLSDTSPIDDDKRYPFASEERFYPGDCKPTRVKIDNHRPETVKSWKDVIHKVAVWLADEGILGVNDCPIGGRMYTFIGHEAVNPDRTPFKDPRQLPNGLILQRGFLNTQEQWRKLKQFLKQPEKQHRAPPKQIQVFYD